MKLERICETQNMILTEEELMENILTSIQSGIEKVKKFGNNISGGLSARSELKSADGKKTIANDNIKVATIELRKELATLYAASTPVTKQVFDKALTKIGASKLQGAYVSRNYYSDYIAYSVLKPLFDVNKASIADKVKDVIVDKFVGFAITAVTGIPNLADIKDAVDMSAALVKATNDLGAKWKSLKVAEELERIQEQELKEVAPYDEEIRKWIEDDDTKSAFKKRYKKNWEKALYATAWNMYKKKLKECVITEAVHQLSITDYAVHISHDKIRIDVKTFASKLARNALHRLAAAAYKFMNGKPVVFPGVIGRDSAAALNDIFGSMDITEVAVNRESYSEYKFKVTDPDDTFGDVDSITIYTNGKIDNNLVRTILVKSIAVTKSRLDKKEDNLTVNDFVWENVDSKFGRGDSFDNNGFEFIIGDVFHLSSKDEVIDVLLALKKEDVITDNMTLFKTKSGGTIFLIDSTIEKSFSLTSNSGWYTLNELTYSKTVERMLEEKGLKELI